MTYSSNTSSVVRHLKPVVAAISAVNRGWNHLTFTLSDGSVVSGVYSGFRSLCIGPAPKRHSVIIELETGGDQPLPVDAAKILTVSASQPA